MKELSTYKGAFNALKLITIITVLGSFITVGLISYMSKQSEKEMLTRIWVKTSDGSVFSTSQQTINSIDDRVIEYKKHVKWFFSLWYSLNKENRERNINAALNLITREEGAKLYDEYVSRGLFEKIHKRGKYIVSKIITEPEISVKESGIIGEFEGEIMFFDETGKMFNSQVVIFQFSVTDVLMAKGRSDENPHAVQINRWVVKKK